MLKNLILVKAESKNVYVNQSIECSLLDNVQDGEYILYLWTNDNCVVIGKNQNAYAEVNVDLLEKEGGLLARRLSGGGAVFHDEGNLNFTFIAKNEDFSLEKNRNIILNALKKLGLNAVLTGRNDIEIDGCKISGNAYLKSRDASLHHGTMLITSLKDKVARYLTPASSKFRDKQVNSVRSRVASLNEFKEVKKEDFAKAIIESFKEEFNLDVEEISSKKIILSSTAQFANEDWIKGKRREYRFKTSFEEDGTKYDVEFNVEDNLVSSCEVYTDSLDQDAAYKMYRRIHKERVDKDDKIMKIINEAYIC